MASILQLIETEVSTVTAILPLIDAELGNLTASLPSVAQTPAVNFKIAGHVFSFVGVFTKVS